MPTTNQVLDLYRREVGTFLIMTELRLLHVKAGADVRGEVLALTEAMESHADDRGPIVVLEDASIGDGRGWPERVERLRAEHATRTEAAPELFAPFVWDEEHTERDPVARFGAAARAMTDALPSSDSDEGSNSTLTLVLAPTRIDDADVWREELRALLDRAELAEVRWLVIDEGEGASLAADLGPAARRCKVEPDPIDISKLAASIDLSEGSTPDFRRFGRAGPKGVFPPKRRAPQHPPLDEDAAKSKQHLIAAAVAAQGGEMTEAVRRQKLACEHAQLGPTEALVVQQMTLAGYVLAAGHMEAAAQEFELAAQWAADAELHGLGAQARLALGALFETQGRHTEAAAEYGASARVAEQGEQAVLAIAAWRAAGRHAEGLGNDPEAAGAYGQAMRVADSDPDAAAVADAPAIARQFVEVLRRIESHEEAARVALAEANEPPASDEPGSPGEPGDEPGEGERS